MGADTTIFREHKCCHKNRGCPAIKITYGTAGQGSNVKGCVVACKMVSDPFTLYPMTPLIVPRTLPRQFVVLESASLSCELRSMF